MSNQTLDIEAEMDNIENSIRAHEWGYDSAISSLQCLNQYIQELESKCDEVEALRERVMELERQRGLAWMAGFEYGWGEAFCDEHTCSPSSKEKADEYARYMSSLIPLPVEPTKGAI